MPATAFRNSTPAGLRPYRPAKLVIRRAVTPLDFAAWRLAQARSVLDSAAADYATACQWLGEVNRRLSPKHRSSGVWSIELRKAWVRSAFRDINRKRTALRAARKAVTALEVA